MDGTELYKEVYFDKYCKNCKHTKREDWKDPCNIDSHKPLNYEEDKND